MRIALLALSLLPYLYYAYHDHKFHLSGRQVSRTEHLLHLSIGLLLLTALGNAFADRQWIFVTGMVFFALAGGIDEYIYHRGIPGEESDLHAKEHLALLIAMVTSLATSWLEAHQWNVSSLWALRSTME